MSNSNHESLRNSLDTKSHASNERIKIHILHDPESSASPGPEPHARSGPESHATNSYESTGPNSLEFHAKYAHARLQ